MFMYCVVVILYAAEGQISVIHRVYSVFCHRRAGLYGRTSLEGIAGGRGSWIKGPCQRTRRAIHLLTCAWMMGLCILVVCVCVSGKCAACCHMSLIFAIIHGHIIWIFNIFSNIRIWASAKRWAHSQWKKDLLWFENKQTVNMKRRVCTKQNMNKKIVPLHVFLKCSFKLYGHARRAKKTKQKPIYNGLNWCGGERNQPSLHIRTSLINTGQTWYK